MQVDLEVLGPRLRELRREAGLRLADLADVTGYSTGYISQIERGQSLPSLSAMATLAVALGVEMSTLIEGLSGPEMSVTRAGSEHTLRFEDFVFRIHGSMGSNRSFSSVVQRVNESDAVFQHYGERFLLVLEGSLDVTIDGERHVVKAGDTIHYSSHQEHTISPPAGETAEMFLVSSPALL